MLQLDEQTGAIILIVGMALCALGYLWLVFRAFGTSWAWGLVTLLLAPLGGGVVYAVTHLRKALGPILVVLLGLATGASPYALNKLFPPQLVVAEGITTGETDLTVTGMPNYDYAQLKQKTDLTVLQMANPEVTDAILAFLAPMSQLKRLDLSDTQITDSGLEILAALPALEDLKLARTQVSDEGIKKFLSQAKALNAITLTGTQVKTATLRDWKNARPNERKYVK